MNNGTDLSDFMIQRTSEDIDLKSVDGKARLAERVKPLINRISRGIFKELIIEKLSALVGLSAKKLEQSISEDKTLNGIIINAGGLSHTSVSILDALLAIKIPKIEVHISNLFTREEFRHSSFISKGVNGIVCGFLHGRAPHCVFHQFMSADRRARTNEVEAVGYY